MTEPPAARKPRADAERNRVLLLETAKAAFAAKGAAVSMDEIARTAGVGAGTLYRHFPTREALVAAVYRNEKALLIAAAEQFAHTEPPVAALRAWLLLFVDFMATKHGMVALLDAMAGGSAALDSASTPQIKEAIATLVDGAVASGAVRYDGDPLNLLRALAGVAHPGAGTDGERAARGLVDILLAGMGAALT